MILFPVAAVSSRQRPSHRGLLFGLCPRHGRMQYGEPANGRPLYRQLRRVEEDYEEDLLPLHLGECLVLLTVALSMNCWYECLMLVV